MKGMVFGERLRKLREGKYTQEELAEKMNVHNITISKWENGAQYPHSNRISELAQILGTTPAYLLGDTDNPENNANLSKAQYEMPPEVKNVGKTLVYERNGERLELPPTEESYAIFREIARMIAGREIAGAVTA